MKKGNIRACINLLREAKTIEDLVLVRTILVQENAMNQSLEFAIRAYDNKNMGDMTNFIFGPSPLGSGQGLIADLIKLAEERGE